MKAARPSGSTVVALCLQGIGIVAEVAAMVAVWSTPTAWWIAASAHVAASGLSSEALRLRVGGRDPDLARTMAQAGWLMGFGFPFFGVIGCAILALRRVPDRADATVESLEASRSRAAQEAREARRAEQTIGAGIDAIVDALGDRDASVRVAAIDALRGQSSRRAVQILSDARENTVFDVRVRAVEGLERISQEHGERIAALRAAWKAAPEDPEQNRRLAEALYEYYELELEDPQMRRQLLDQAIDHARAAARGGDRQAALLLGAALLARGDAAASEAVYRELLAQRGFDVEAFQGLARAQFRRKDFSAVAQTARWGLRHGATVDPALREALTVLLAAEAEGAVS